MKKPRLISWIFCAVLAAATSLSYSQEKTSARVLSEIGKATAELAEGPALDLPPTTDGQVPPETITKAGQEFVKVWTVWRQISEPRPKPKTKEPGSPDPKPINADQERELFDKLLLRTIAANPPVDPAEYSRFTYSSLDWCGDGAMAFSRDFQQGYVLALLRAGDPFAALQNLSDSPGPALDNLLRAFGTDPEEFAIGQWLGHRGLPDKICRSGGEKTASMILAWMEMRWEEEAARRKEKVYSHPPDEPHFPRAGDIMQLLRSGNKVTDETKAKIARFIGTNGTRMEPISYWIYSSPKGSAKWLAGLATTGLTDPLNRTRTKSSQILTTAGIDHQIPELRPAPLFRVSVNGELRNDFTPGISFGYAAGGGRALRLNPAPDGLFTTDPDHFFDNGPVTHAEVYRLPGAGGKPLSPHDPWLHAQVPLPPKFGAVTDIPIVTTEVTIQPRFPSSPPPAEDDITEIEFDRQSPGHTPDGSINYYHVKGSSPLVIDHVSPGGYWLRVRHPGTALMSRIKITVSKDHNEFKPELERGATLVVPIQWPEGKIPGNLPGPIARKFAWGGETGGYSGLLELRREGKEFKEIGPVPVGAAEKFPHCAIFANLPPGSYEIRLPAINGEATPGEDAFSIKADSIHFSIGKDSPSFVTSDPLYVDFKSP